MRLQADTEVSISSLIVFPALDWNEVKGATMNTYRIRLIIEASFIAGARNTFALICGNGNFTETPDNQDAPTTYTLEGTYTGDAEFFSHDKFNWSQVGQWHDEIISSL